MLLGLMPHTFQVWLLFSAFWLIVVLTASVAPLKNHQFFVEEFVYRAGTFEQADYKTSDSQIEQHKSEDVEISNRPRIVEIDGRRFIFYSAVVHSTYETYFDVPGNVVTANNAEQYARYYLNYLESNFWNTLKIILIIAFFPPLAILLIGFSNKLA